MARNGPNRSRKHLHAQARALLDRRQRRLRHALRPRPVPTKPVALFSSPAERLKTDSALRTISSNMPSRSLAIGFRSRTIHQGPGHTTCAARAACTHIASNHWRLLGTNGRDVEPLISYHAPLQAGNAPRRTQDLLAKHAKTVMGIFVRLRTSNSTFSTRLVEPSNARNI